MRNDVADACTIGGEPPFPEVVPAPAELMRMGFNLSVVSNTDDAIIADNVLQR
jgi:hypothetical protein